MSGFAFTSLSVFIGFYSNKLSEASDIISVLFICTVLFMLTGEMAREAYKLSKYVLAETTYMAALSLLATYFLIFVLQKIPFVSPITVVVLLVAIAYFIYRGVHNVYLSIKQIRKQIQKDQMQATPQTSKAAH